MKAAANYFASGQCVLDYGAGSGFCSSLIAKIGCEVEAIDVETRPLMYWPVRIYSGVRLPYSDGAFDVVFTCFALEHLPDLSRGLREMTRVMKPDGRMIHIVPTSAWRFWSNVTHCLWTARLLLRSFVVRHLARHWTARQEHQAPEPEEKAPDAGRHSWRMLVPPRHGELASNAMTEIAQYRLSRWRQIFAEAALEVVAERPTGVFDVEYLLLANISERARILLAQFLGSSGYVFVLRPRYSAVARRKKSMRSPASARW